MRKQIKLPVWPVIVNVLMLSVLLLYVLIVSGCAASVTRPSPALPKLPPKPKLSPSQPSTPYLESARSDTKQWRERLQATQLMRKNSGTDGQSTAQSK